MSENSKYKFGNGISITTGFDVSTQLPLDSRTVVQTQADLENISENVKYEGLLVFVVDQNKLYQWKQELFEDGTYAEEYSWGPIESEISAKGVESLDEIDFVNTKSLQMQKNKGDFFPITHNKFVYNEEGESLFDELNDIVSDITDLESKMDETIEEFRETINQAIADLNQSVTDMQNQTAADMETMKNNLQKEIDNVLADLNAKSKEMDEEFAELLKKVDTQITELQDKIQDDIDQMLQDVDNSILSDGQIIDLMDQINANIAAIDAK